MVYMALSTTPASTLVKFTTTASTSRKLDRIYKMASRPVFEDHSSDEDGNESHDFSYTDQQQLKIMHSRMQALDIAGAHQRAASSSSSQSQFRDVDDLPPVPKIETRHVPSVVPKSPFRKSAEYDMRRRKTLDNYDAPNTDELRELASMYGSVAECLDMRTKYMDLSLQDDRRNPKNQSNWSIYPPRQSQSMIL